MASNNDPNRMHRMLSTLTKELAATNRRIELRDDDDIVQRADIDAYRDFMHKKLNNTNKKLDNITKSIDALTKKLGDYHETSTSLHTTLSAAIVKIQNVLVANGEKLAGLKPTIRGTWIRGQAGYSDKMERFEKNDVKDPVNLKL